MNRLTPEQHSQIVQIDFENRGSVHQANVRYVHFMVDIVVHLIQLFETICIVSALGVL